MSFHVWWFLGKLVDEAGQVVGTGREFGFVESHLIQDRLIANGEVGFEEGEFLERRILQRARGEFFGSEVVD